MIEEGEFVSVKEVAKWLGVVPLTIRNMYKRGEFPEPIHLSTRKFCWKKKVVQEWLEKREAESNNGN